VTEQGRRSRTSDFLSGALAGGLIGMVAKELELALLVSYWGDTTVLAALAFGAGGALGLSSYRSWLRRAALTLCLLWAIVAFTPLTHWMASTIERRDPLERADAVFVLASALQRDGELGTSSMARLLRGLEILGEGWAPRLILSELPEPRPRYEAIARQTMERLGLEQEILTVGPVRNTHDEAVEVGALFRERGYERLVVVTSESHSRRASAALESQGVTVTAQPASENAFDVQNLFRIGSSDDHVTAFGPLAHEYVGLFYYRVRGWIQ